MKITQVFPKSVGLVPFSPWFSIYYCSFTWAFHGVFLVWKLNIILFDSHFYLGNWCVFPPCLFLFFFCFSCQKTTLNQSCWVHRMGGWVLGHQVGVIDGLMTTFLDVDSVVVEQVVPMTRFTIRTLDLYCEGWGRYPKFWSADSFWESLGPPKWPKTIQVKDLGIIHCL